MNYQQRDRGGGGDDREAAEKGVGDDGSDDRQKTNASIHNVVDLRRVDPLHIKFFDEVHNEVGGDPKRG